MAEVVDFSADPGAWYSSVGAERLECPRADVEFHHNVLAVKERVEVVPDGGSFAVALSDFFFGHFSLAEESFLYEGALAE